VTKPPTDKESVDKKQDIDTDSPPPPKSFDLCDTSADRLLDGNEEDLKCIADAIEDAWDDFQQNSTEDLNISVVLPSGGEISDFLPINRGILELVTSFCNEETWGGLIETHDLNSLDSLAHAADKDSTKICCDRIVNLDGEWFSLDQLFAGWDEDIGDPSLKFQQMWDNYKTIRISLLSHLPKLMFHAREWLDGRPEILNNIRQYLELAAKLYRGVQENYHVMGGDSPDWARMTLESLLALDVLQIRVHQPNGDTVAKAILLPTHPLQLWRNERLSSLLRGLAQNVELTSEDREVICDSLKRPEHFLSVVRLGSVPDGKGLAQLLPLAGQIAGLPVFENLINACSGLDGIKCLAEAIDQYVVLHPNHPFPLRIAIVNPPHPEALLADFVRILNDPRYRGGQRLAAMNVDIYATAKHRDRIDAALCFSESRYEDLVQEKVASGRLILNLHDSLPDEATLGRIVENIQQNPVHLAAIFDESTINIRRRSAGHLLPMSPFCVRHELKLDRRTGTIEIKPQPGESPFSEFLLLMSELEGTQRDTTPYAHADAKSLAQTADTLLQGETSAARWVFLADRALPPESGMHSVNIWERREGQRDIFLAARDFATLSRLLRPVFDKCNLTVSPEAMSKLLHQGARLLGSGLLGIIKRQDGKPDQKLVVGFAGLILAARDFQRRYPDCLVLSVDHPLARLWLRTGTRTTEDRCDLIVLRKEVEKLIITAVEVKSSLSEELNDAHNRLNHAKEQVKATLQALEDRLSAAWGDAQSPLSIPRCEMFKHTLARAAQARTADPMTDRENRKRWGSWLIELFPESNSAIPSVTLEGSVISVLLLKASSPVEESVSVLDGKSIYIRTLCEEDIELLIKPVEPTDFVGHLSSRQDDNPQNSRVAGSIDGEETMQTCLFSLENHEKTPSTFSQNTQPYVGSSSESQNMTSKTPFTTSPHPNFSTTKQSSNIWPPPVNPLGMIGQYEAVNRLVEQALYARNTGRRFSDKLLVGPAGVGKSTLVRKIAELLLGREHIFFSGSSLRQPRDLIERMRQDNLIPDQSSNERFIINPCLIFIDEVHGISTSVATALLSVMDDARVTTIDNILFDFRNVILLLATTDQGRLSEAFQSRPNKTWLRPYTLHELAGIIWLHGKSALEGAELSKDACYEIAARCRCNPRRSVRDLTETLIPHFYSRMHRSIEEEAIHAHIAEIMSAEYIAEFYEQQGIDFNGLDNLANRFLTYLRSHGSASEATLALGISHPNDFLEVAEYLSRLGLIETSPAGRRLTKEGLRYLKEDPRPDLRVRISRAM